jgi:phenylacetate-CoA ligase
MTGLRDRERSRAVIDGWRSFLDASPAMTEGDGSGWAARVYHRAVDEVPAYRAFLVEQGLPVGPAPVTDFADLPLVTKENYLRRFPLPSRCRGGRLAAGDMLAVSSGSSGSPTIWPRTVLDELPVALRFEQVFRGSFRADERRTLAVVCFPLGSWVGGMYTTSCCRHLAAKGYPITVVAPGNDVAEILRVVREIGAMFDQVVLLGYPPFVKGVLDVGAADGLDWAGLHVRLVFAGEVFSEQWRDLLTARIGSRSPWLDTASLYGTADARVLGTETPVSIAIRGFLAETPAAARELFGQARLPTLVQYDPTVRYFETVDSTLVFTADGTLPLIRYHLADDGGLVGHDAMLAFCRDHGFDPVDQVRRITDRPGPALPFVYVFGRSMFAVSFYGANVYPENVTVGLEQPDVAEWTTGKFVLMVTESGPPRLRVVVELADGLNPDAARDPVVAASIQAALVRLNSEFAHYVPAAQRIPLIEQRVTGDPEYFPVGVKHRYTRGVR